VGALEWDRSPYGLFDVGGNPGELAKHGNDFVIRAFCQCTRRFCTHPTWNSDSCSEEKDNWAFRYVIQEDLLKALGQSKHSLEEGIRQLTKSPEVALSGKFEMEDGHLSLSIYTAEKGLEVDPERNVLKEFAGSPEAAEWKPNSEVFKDVPHVARASTQLTIMSASRFSLLDILAKAKKDQEGTVYSIAPMLRDRKAVFVVLVAAGAKSVELRYDAATGARIDAK